MADKVKSSKMGLRGIHGYEYLHVQKTGRRYLMLSQVQFLNLLYFSNFKSISLIRRGERLFKVFLS